MAKPTLYHGGGPGRMKGQALLPPDKTGAASSASFGNYMCRRDRVYVTTCRDTAMMYAAMHPSQNGQIYIVEPRGVLVPDLDCRTPGISWECEEAIVIERLRTKGKHLARIRKWMIQDDPASRPSIPMPR